MTRILMSVLGGLLVVAAGIFWWQGRAETEVGAAPPLTQPGQALAPEELPTGDPGGLRGAAPPEATEQTREQRRFDRLDRDRDARVTRTEMLSPRADQFRKLDANRDNLLTFEEWAVKTSTRFAGADGNRDGWLNRVEYATTKPKRPAQPECRCPKPALKAVRRPPRQPPATSAPDETDEEGAGEPDA